MPTPDSSEKTLLPPLSKEEIAFLIKAIWAALQAPGWTFKNRKDLEKLGEALFSGKSLKEVDDALYDRIFPHLVLVATHLGDTLRSQVPESPYHEIAVEKSAPVTAPPAAPQLVATQPAATQPAAEQPAAEQSPNTLKSVPKEA
jgi:hypothetical protein